MMIKIENEGHR